ncbi:hypothetical protein PLICRDRAFT_40956 [Plicaturopsis crispa FD-325 SS-3]|nr:hypothetical protein PLICRDRAFT_40956 [Plicaturopsis crispa FD-325 SS-3]
MRITIHNLTADTVVCDVSGRCERLHFLPGASTTLEDVWRRKIFLAPQEEDDDTSLEKKDGKDGKPVRPNADLDRGCTIRVSRSGRSFKSVAVPKGCPWHICRVKASGSRQKLLILPRRDLSAFLASMPDPMPLSSLLLPGTHDTMAFYGWPISQCQSPDTPLLTQLQSGIRVLDIRLSAIRGRLIAFHGAYPQREPFLSILATIYAFLAAHPSETLVMSIKQEDGAVTSADKFARLVKAEIGADAEKGKRWFLEDRVPVLGEVRGKIVMLSRFGDPEKEALGIHPPLWPDSAKDGFSWTCGETQVKVHDWYSIPSFLSIPEKVQRATAALLPGAPSVPSPSPSYAPSVSSSPSYAPAYIAPIPPPSRTPLAISYFSAASFPLAPPPAIARGFGWPAWGMGVEGVNARVARWAAEQLGLGDDGDIQSTQRTRDTRRNGEERTEPRIRGWALMDYCGEPEGLLALLVECNFRGRVRGEEGW